MSLIYNKATQIELFPLTLEERLNITSLNPVSDDKGNEDCDDDKFYASKELRKTPIIPQIVYDGLPQILKCSSALFSNPREKDVFLTSALSVLSGIFSTVIGTYDRKVVHPNLFSFIIAPPASDKSAMIFAKSLGSIIHQKLLADSKIRISEYLKRKKDAKNKPKPETEVVTQNEYENTPERKMLFIPANSSSASVISHLEQSDQIGIIIETEADTMANTFKQDWGGYSDVIRKSFHHETISYSRKRENEFIEVERPKLSISLTGTPSQVGGLIRSASDGLFSRFIFYAYSTNQKWRNVSTDNNINLTAYFDELGKKVSGIYSYLKKFDMQFDLRRYQWKIFNERFGSLLIQTDRLTGGESPSTVKRMGLITYRIAMILSILRSFENSLPMDEIICEDEDFGLAMLLSKIYMQHSLFMFESLKPGEEGEPKTASLGITRFLNAIKSQKSHKRKALVEIGKNMGIQERTIDLYLKRLIDKNLLYKSDRYGEYFKR